MIQDRVNRQRQADILKYQAMSEADKKKKDEQIAKAEAERKRQIEENNKLLAEQQQKQLEEYNKKLQEEIIPNNVIVAQARNQRQRNVVTGLVRNPRQNVVIQVPMPGERVRALRRKAEFSHLLQLGYYKPFPIDFITRARKYVKVYKHKKI